MTEEQKSESELQEQLEAERRADAQIVIWEIAHIDHPRHQPLQLKVTRGYLKRLKNVVFAEVVAYKLYDQMERPK